MANERTVAKEIRDEYVDTMSKIYYSYFKSYSNRLLKVQVSHPHSNMNPDIRSVLCLKSRIWDMPKCFILRLIFPDNIKL